jgi:hypothetical protein
VVTPLTNIRITTFVGSETEVKVIDTNKLEVIEAVGCKVREVYADSLQETGNYVH